MSSPNQNKLAIFLKSLRLSARMSLRQVEKVTGISNAYLSQLENGRTVNPSPRLLEKLADAFDTSYGDLMSAAGYLPNGIAPTRATLEVSNLTNELNLRERREVVSFIENLIARRKNILED